MSSLGLETVLVCDVSHGVVLAIRAGVGELAADLDGFVIGTGVLQLALLLLGNPVRGVKTEKQIGYFNAFSFFLSATIN